MSARIQHGAQVEVHGFVMLAKVPEGRYKVVNLGDGTYQFYRPRGTKALVRHYISSVDAWIKPQGDEDQNKIVILERSKEP